MKYHILNPVLLSLLQDMSLEIKIQARCSCQLILSTFDGLRAWEEGLIQSIGFTSIPGEIKISPYVISKIYLKHLKPDEKLDLPRTRNDSALAIFVK